MTSSRVPVVNVRLCRGTAVLAVLTGLAFLAGNAIGWLVPSWAEQMARGFWLTDCDVKAITLTPLVRALCMVLSTSYLAVLAYGLWIMRTLFSNFAVGRVFEPETGILLRRFGQSLLIYAALTPVVGTLMVLLITMNHPPGEFLLLRVGVEETEVVVALIGALVLVLGSVMADAARMADDNRQIV